MRCVPGDSSLPRAHCARCHPAASTCTPAPSAIIPPSKDSTHPGGAEHKLIGRAEQVFVNNYPLRQVLERGHLARGIFCVDLDAKKLCVQSRTTPRTEAGMRPVIWEFKGDHISIGEVLGVLLSVAK